MSNPLVCFLNHDVIVRLCASQDHSGSRVDLSKLMNDQLGKRQTHSPLRLSQQPQPLSTFQAYSYPRLLCPHLLWSQSAIIVVNVFCA